MAAIYEIFGDDAHAMTLALMERADVMSMIPAGSSVALKPNLVLASPAENGATTHPGVVSGCVEYLRRGGVRDICVIESSWVGEKTGRSLRETGLDRVCGEYGVPFFDLKQDTARTVDTPLRPMEICARALDAGFLIDLPVLKGHCQTAMTCALKNLKGCIPDREKRRFHAEGLFEPIAALAAALRPGLTVVDGICGDLNFEEGGTPVPTHRMYLCADPVTADAYGCSLMGLSPPEVPYVAMAEAWGAGSARFHPEDVIALNAPEESRTFPPVSGLVRRLTRSVRADGACSACYAALVRALYLCREEGRPVDAPIAIGQGYRGRSFPGLGVGRCCAGAERCAKGCPPAASDVAELLRKYT